MLGNPLAALPLTLEGLLFAALMLAQLLPVDGGVAPAAAVFPFDLYFDLKQGVATSSGWIGFGVSVAALVLFRSGLLALTAAFADERVSGLPLAFRNALLLSVRGVILLLPSAALYFISVATRYAPFAWIAAALGFFAAWRLCRRGVALDTGAGIPSGPVPELSSFFLYGAALMTFGAAISSLSEGSLVPAAALVACAGPLHALVWLGWRARAVEPVASSEGRLVVICGFMMIVALLVSSVIDRNLRDYDIVPADYEGSLLALGGVDSTNRRGPLAELDPGALGYTRDQTELLSYRADGRRYRSADTRGDLETIALQMGAQIGGVDRNPVVLLGHSQASLILDRILESNQTTLDAAAIISPTPPRRPSVDVPPPGRPGRGRVGGDLARAFAELLDVADLASYDVDAPASPTNLDTLVVPRAEVPRLALWALGDSILLEDDWRRTGEVNLVVFSDHVGATRNPRALDAARLFLQGEDVGSDETSWRSVLVTVLRYAFEPWRP